MPENILIAIAWPYSNAEIHVGNITGSHLPGDIVARYHRLKGNHVLMVSGTDSHGTPVTIAADKEGKPAKTEIKNPQGKVMEKPGAVRDGGSFYERMGAVSCWNAVMDEDRYMVQKWNQFIAA